VPDIAGALNLEVRLPLAEGPGFLGTAFVELEDEGTVAIGVLKENGAAYAYSRITAEQWWRMSRALFPEGDPGDGDAAVRRSSD
jgi:hypothetical protein